eukprot:jgi/Tetstr1/420373/TSEL_011491.t1
MAVSSQWRWCSQQSRLCNELGMHKGRAGRRHVKVAGRGSVAGIEAREEFARMDGISVWADTRAPLVTEVLIASCGWLNRHTVAVEVKSDGKMLSVRPVLYPQKQDWLEARTVRSMLEYAVSQ